MKKKLTLKNIIFVENILSLFIALAFVLLLRSCVIEAFRIPSGSMMPNLIVGDHIFVSKLTYGIKIPFYDWITDHPIYIIERDPPKRGDMIIFKFPKNEKIYYIKRVVGIPGDRIEILNKIVYINGIPLKRKEVPQSKIDYFSEYMKDSKYNSKTIEFLYENIGNKEVVILIDNMRPKYESNTDSIIIPKDEYFVLGDNRDYSNDSRYWGNVPKKNIRGKASFIWMSTWIDSNKGEFTFRPKRIGSILR